MHIPSTHLTKPLESTSNLHTNLPDATSDHVAKGLEAMVEHSQTNADVSHGIHMHSRNVFEVPWIHRMVPGIEKLAAEYHIGNFVCVRDRGRVEAQAQAQGGEGGEGEGRIFESMPIYARIGMHLLFYGHVQRDVLKTHSIEELLKKQSIKQGTIYNSPESTASIPSFIKTYSIDVNELLEPDITKYGCFNEFFFRKLKPEARPVDDADNPLGICSAADCRLTVYQTVTLAKKFWIKGAQFTIPNLLQVPPDSPTAQEFSNASIGIFRLAPADYHRFHCPVDGVIGEVVDVPGQYYTVNPQAVTEIDFDVFTANVRSILYITHTKTGKRIAFVAIGALLVGSVVWTKGKEKGENVGRGDELGYFAYGGSTVIVLFPDGVVEFDEDLVKNSEEPVETLVKVGWSIGKTVVRDA